MLYLSLLHLSRREPRWRNLEAYQAHQVIWRAFPEASRDGARPFLFSLEDHRTHYNLLVQSTAAPDWSHVADAAGVETKTFDPSILAPGTRLHYFIRVNPTVDRQGFADGKKRRVAVGLNRSLTAARMGVDEAEVPDRETQLKGWMERQGEAGGFLVELCSPGPTVTRRFHKNGTGRPSGPPMTLHEVELTGTLQVTDVEAFARTCAGGLGRGKAFGFGLLMVRPA